MDDQVDFAKLPEVKVFTSVESTHYGFKIGRHRYGFSDYSHANFDGYSSGIDLGPFGAHYIPAPAKAAWGIVAGLLVALVLAAVFAVRKLNSARTEQ
jgi:hypothetical protein